MSITIGMVDDHQLLLRSLSALVNTLADCHVSLEALSGEELLQKLELIQPKPDILLIDVNMPGMNGIEVARKVATKYPEIKMVALSMNDKDAAIIDMLNAGCCAYLLKQIHPTGLENALLEVYTKGYYFSDAANLNFRRLIQKAKEQAASVFTDRDKQFLKLAASDLTYKQIAIKMCLAERTIDGYRETLFEKFEVKSRTAMILKALKRNIITLEECDLV